MTTPPYDVQGLADLLGVSVDWVYTQVEAKTIPCTRLPGGRLIRFTDEHVAQILADGDQPAEHKKSTPARRAPAGAPVGNLAAARAKAHERRAAEIARRRTA